MTRRKAIFAAFGAGVLISLLLAFLTAMHYHEAILILQMPGFIVGALIWDVHGGGGNWFEAVMILANALIYGAVLLFLGWMVRLTMRALN